MMGLGKPLRKWYYRRAWGKIPPEAQALGIANADVFWGNAKTNQAFTRKDKSLPPTP